MQVHFVLYSVSGGLTSLTTGESKSSFELLEGSKIKYSNPANRKQNFEFEDFIGTFKYLSFEIPKESGYFL